MAATVGQLGVRLDVLVNNAGVYGEFVPFADADMAGWARVIEANVLGTAYCTRSLLPIMLAQRGGTIVNLVSRAAVHDDPDVAGTAYAVSKAAVARLTTALAHETSDSGVQVVAISPGLVDTAMTARRPDRQRMHDVVWTSAERTANAIAMLVSGRYRALNGRIVHARDDLDELRSRLCRDPSLRRLSVIVDDPNDPFA